jgi:aminopeptidase N
MDYSSDDVVAHELAHHWFGDLITCRDWQHIWLNEGFATYSEARSRDYNLIISNPKPTHENGRTHFV